MAGRRIDAIKWKINYMGLEGDDTLHKKNKNKLEGTTWNTQSWKIGKEQEPEPSTTISRKIHIHL